jgi:hypothetical protein
MKLRSMGLYRSTTTKPGPDGSVEYVLRAIVREQPPRGLALPIGDAIQNIRSALDHLVYELAPPNVRKKNKTQFPIYTDERRFKERSTSQIEGIVGDERTLIERVQPFNAPHGANDNPLTVLNQLSNRDKHRLLVPVIAAVSETDIWVASDNADIHFQRIESGPVKHDAEIVRFTARPKGRPKEMKVHPQSGLEIQISDTGPAVWPSVCSAHGAAARSFGACPTIAASRSPDAHVFDLRRVEPGR